MVVALTQQTPTNHRVVIKSQETHATTMAQQYVEVLDGIVPMPIQTPLGHPHTMNLMIIVTMVALFPARTMDGQEAVAPTMEQSLVMPPFVQRTDGILRNVYLSME